MAAHQVQALLMGGQACVFYGGAEFSRDTDFAILASPENLDRLSKALQELRSEQIFVPSLELDYLLRGHAVHFRCQHPEAENMRVDVMSVMRGVDPFPELWNRRTTLEQKDGMIYELLSLPDLVTAKKTQRDKDWPMIRRLVDTHYLQNRSSTDETKVRFWLRELRSPDYLLEIAAKFPEWCKELISQRPLLVSASASDRDPLADGLEKEEKEERARDRLYWLPLRKELEQLRHGRAL